MVPLRCVYTASGGEKAAPWLLLQSALTGWRVHTQRWHPMHTLYIYHCERVLHLQMTSFGVEICRVTWSV